MRSWNVKAVAPQYNIQAQHQTKALLPPPSLVHLLPASGLSCPLCGAAHPMATLARASVKRWVELADPTSSRPRSQHAATHPDAGAVPCCSGGGRASGWYCHQPRCGGKHNGSACRELQGTWKPDVQISSPSLLSATLAALRQRSVTKSTEVSGDEGSFFLTRKSANRFFALSAFTYSVRPCRICDDFLW